MLTTEILDSLAQRDTAFVADALQRSQVLGTAAGDLFFSVIGNYPDRAIALRSELQRRGMWEVAA